MRLIIVGKEKSFKSFFVLTRLLKKSDADIVGVIANDDKKTIKERFADPAIRLLSKIFPRYILSIDRLPSLKRVAKQNNIPLLITMDINSREPVEFCRDLQPDYVFNTEWCQLFKDMLKQPKKGCINVHTSLLPRYKGAHPVREVLKNNDKETGVTIHYMNEKIDEGEIILQKKHPITSFDDEKTLFFKLSQLATDLSVEAVSLLKDEDKIIKQQN